MRIATLRMASMAVLAACLVGCSGSSKSSGGSEVIINGAGASFPAPVYQLWTHGYSQGHEGITVNYQSLGSGAGINQLKEGTVDFAGTDNPLEIGELQRLGIVQFPMLMGSVVVIVNLPGVKNNQLRLSRNNLADIFLGKIRCWDDPRLKDCGASLPALPITVVRRADASGTSFIFTDYLSSISAEWKRLVGSGTSVKWPVGIGGQKNPGVCNSVRNIQGAIGYTEYTYAVEGKLTQVQLENQAGRYVTSDIRQVEAATAQADWEHAPGLALTLNDQPGEKSWPIVGVTYILFRKDCPPVKNVRLLEFLRWCFTSGEAGARRLHYVPLPHRVIETIERTVFLH